MIFGPKPLPTKGAITRTCRSLRPSMPARPLRTNTGACVVSQIVIWLARISHCATTPRVSIGDEMPCSYQNRRFITLAALAAAARSEEHTSELQAPVHLGGRL